MSALTFVSALDTSSLEVVSGLTGSSIPRVVLDAAPFVDNGSCEGSKLGWSEVGCVLS